MNAWIKVPARLITDVLDDSACEILNICSDELIIHDWTDGRTYLMDIVYHMREAVMLGEISWSSVIVRN